MSGANFDISGLNEDELEALMAKLARAKQQRAKRTPEPYSPPSQRRRDFTPETDYADSHRPSYRDEHRYASGSPPVRTPGRVSALEDSDSDDFEALETFFNSNIKQELPDEEWLFVPMTSRRSDPRRIPLMDWLRIGAEEELYEGADYSRRTEYRRSQSPVSSQYRAQPPAPRDQSPLSRLPDMDSVDVFNLGTRPSRYLEKVERKSVSSPPCLTPTDPSERGYKVADSPVDHLVRQSPDWSRDGTASPPRGIDQMTGHRYSPQAPPSGRYINALPTRQTPSPKLSAGRGPSPLERMNISGYQTAPPARGDSPGQAPPSGRYINALPTRQTPSPKLSAVRGPSPLERMNISGYQTAPPARGDSPGPERYSVSPSGRDRQMERREAALQAPRTQQTRMPARPGIARPQIRAPQGGLRQPRTLQTPSHLRPRPGRET